MKGNNFRTLHSGGLSERIITTLQLADRRGYSLSLSYLSRMLIHGEAHEEEVGREINGMLEVSNHDGICCLKGREHLIPETRRRLLRNGIVGKKYEAKARRFAGKYASLALPFVRRDAYMAYELLKQKPIFGIDFYRKIFAKNMWLKTEMQKPYALFGGRI